MSACQMSNSLFSQYNFTLFHCDPKRALLFLPNLHEHHFWRPNHSLASYFSAFSANLHGSDGQALHQQSALTVAPSLQWQLILQELSGTKRKSPEEDPVLQQGRSFSRVLAAITLKGVILLFEIKLGEETQLQ